MKPAPFEYARPATVAEAADLLADDSVETKLLAGGQSLVPLMNFRLARPERLVDLNGVDELRALSVEDDELRIGAMVRTAELERSAAARDHWGLLADAVRHIGHFQVRNRGTVGGTVAHADPTAELPIALRALNATVRIRSRAGERVASVADLAVGPMMTSLESDEIVAEIRVPAPRGLRGRGFEEFARRPGDFALAAVACVVTDQETRFVVGGVTACPRDVRVDGHVDASAVRGLLSRDLESLEGRSDVHADGAYRKRLAIELGVRAHARATEGGA